MSGEYFFNETMLVNMARQIEMQNTELVAMPKPVARALVSEMRRFYAGLTATEQQKIELLRTATMHYACLHISDLLRSISDTSENDEVSSAMMFAVAEIMALAETATTEMKTVGNA